MSNAIFPSQVRGLGYTVVKSPEDAVIKQQSPSWVQTRIVQSQNPIWHWTLLYDFLIDNSLKPNPSYAYTDLQQLLGFVTARRDSYDDFVFLDPDDNFYGPGIITQSWLPAYPFALGAIIVIGGNAWQVSAAPGGARSGYGQPAFSSSPQTDGGLTWVQLGAAVGGSAWPNPYAQLQVVTDGTNYYSPLQVNRGGQFLEDITDLASAPTVYANGTLTSTYSLGFGGLSFSGFASSGMYLNWGTAPPALPVTASFNYYFRVHFEDDTQDFEKWANQWWTIGGSEGSKGKGELKLVTSRVPSSVFNSGNTFVPSLPFPPFSPCPNATQTVEIYPTKVSVGQAPPIAIAIAQAGPQAFADLILSQVGLGSPKPSAAFSGFVLPASVPSSAVKCVYCYSASGCAMAGGVGFSWVFLDGSTGLTSGANSFGNPFQQLSVVRVDSGSGGSRPAGAYPYVNANFTCVLSASLPGIISPPYNAYFIPRMVVAY